VSLDYDKYLPGDPSKKLVREVRRYLTGYGIRPSSITKWRATWEWASRIRTSYVHPRWPGPKEIAAQFVFLLFLQMQEDWLRLPPRAQEKQPDSVRALVAAAAARATHLAAIRSAASEKPKELPAHGPDALAPALGEIA